MDTAHPMVRQIEFKHQLGRQEAEQFLRGLAGSDPAAAKAVAQIDAGRERRRRETLEANRANAEALGMTPDAARDLAVKLAARPDLFTWLCARVHVTLAHDRPLEHHE